MASQDQSPATGSGRKTKQEETMNQTKFAATMDATPVVTIGANFTGANFLDFGANPPDTDGAVGPSQFVELLNSAYRVYDKSGNVLQTSSLNQFWSSAGILQASAFDPRVLYDPDSQRWYAAAVDFGGALLLAVSNTSDPTQGFQAVTIPIDPTGQNFGDFTRLGFNEDGVYLSATMVPVGAEQATSIIVAIPKSDLLGPTPTTANATVFANISHAEIGVIQQPAVAPQLSGSEPLLSAFNVDMPSTLLKVSSIDGLITSPTLDSANRVISVSPFHGGSGAIQEGTTVLVNAGDTSFTSSVVLQNDKLFGVQTIWSDDGHPELRWYDIGNPLTNPVVLDSGIISPPGLDVYYGSIAVNPLGEAVIGFSGSGPNDYPSAYAVAGTLNGDVLQFGDPMLLKAGVAPADLNNGRFGDYSATTYDPADPSHFWTIQEWTSPSYWSTEISEIIFSSAAPPIAMADRNHVATPHGEVAVDSAHGVLANDTEPVPGYTLSVSAVNGLSDNVGHSVAGEFGTLTLNADGGYSYVDTAKPRDLPHKGVGEDVFTYTASDGHGGTSDSTLTILVTRPHQEYTLGTPGQTLTNGNRPAVLDGALGDQTLLAGKSPAVLIGGPNDTLVAAHSPDTFVFGPTNFGANTIKNFNVQQDTIQIDHTLFANFAAVQSHAAQTGADTVITADAANTITLEGIALSHLHTSDFLFV
jgi:VCBS repeat-containing protein